MQQAEARNRAVWVPDEMFAKAERDARDYSVFPGNRSPSVSTPLEGLLTLQYCRSRAEELQDLAVDQYITEVLEPAEAPKRPSARQVIKQLKGKVLDEIVDGPLYAVELELTCDAGPRRVGILAQNREVNNGVWGPEHHQQAVSVVRNFADLNMPIVTFMDTPGADAGAEANHKNQAHSISRLLAEMCNLSVPTVGIVYGLGYSGGAIPLAATNILLSVRSAVFNTIQPKGLASIARQYNLSWQECAHYVGLSSYELLTKGVVDGVIDYAPDDKEPVEKLQTAICSAIESVEQASRNFAALEPAVLGQYQRAVGRYLNPSKELKRIKSVTDFSFSDARRVVPDVFGLSMRHLRYVGMRRRLRTSTLDVYGRLAAVEIPSGDLAERTRQAHDAAFDEWLKDPDRIVYNEQLAKALKNYRQRREGLAKERGRLTSLLLGEPQRNYENAREALCFNLGLYLYNRWKTSSTYNFRKLIQLVAAPENRRSGDEIFDIPDTELTVRDVVFDGELRETLTKNFVNLLIFDALYDSIVNGFADIAGEARADHRISEKSLQKLLESSLELASRQVQRDEEMDETGRFLSANSNLFSGWIQYFIKFNGRGAFLKDVEEWKRVAFTRLSDALLVLITFIFEVLVPQFLTSQTTSKSYDGHIKPKRIGKRKDFWNQLEIAYNDVLVQRVLDDLKRRKLTSVAAIRDRFFKDFQELDSNLMTADPVGFPGFRLSIERALKKGHTPCGVVTGIGRLAFGSGRKVGILLSNVDFQAGAFDMASAEKLSRLLNECVSQRLPVICFVSSGGMQTKEGPSALFAMAISNDRITRFVRDNDLPIIVFGFGDCTGGSQASFVTHPMVQTYYFSGANMPFAGRVVVPSFLPSQSIVSNYLSVNAGSMRGLVHHPFAETLNQQLQDIDPEIPLPTESVEEVIERVFKGTYLPDARKAVEWDSQSYVRSLMRPIKRVLIHGRGCTAVKLTRIAKQRGTSVVLVQSDPDMDSVAADMLTGSDEVVSLGGQTPDESYLNAMSVFAIASRERVDALHPGIGFLSENEDFARTCRKRGLNFIGPYAKNMDVMGNKSNAINTAIANDVPVVPGSHGILTSAGATAQVADEVGYPVLLKAVHGGGGKGIKVVRSADDIQDAFATVFAEAKSAFGNGDLYLEKFVESLRHIEVQILRDSIGNTRILGIRDCSVQRNNQKILEESESVRLPQRLEEDAYRHARNLADAINYLGAGTVEFIYDLTENALYFMEMNTRLQVEHPVTEWTTGISIVEEQFRIAEGSSIEHIEVNRHGYAIEARINAEKGVLDPDGGIDLMPSPGHVSECHFPTADNIEVIAAIARDKTVSPFYDSLVAQIIAYGENRWEGIDKLNRYLKSIRIAGICTNIPLLTRVLEDPAFQKGQYDTRYLPEFLGRVDKDRLLGEMAQTGVTSNADATSVRIDGSDELKVLSPQTGIFYSTPSPSDPPYAAVGDRITLDETLCQIEAMKIFTSVSLATFNGSETIYPVERQYEVVRINQANATQVNAGDLLFVIRPV